MPARNVLQTTVALLAAVLLPRGATGLPAPATPELAKRLADAVRIGADDVVLVRANPDALRLAELVAAEAVRRGAAVRIVYTTAGLLRTALAEGSDSLLERASPWETALGAAGVIVDLGGNDDPAAEAGIDAVRLAKARRGAQAEADRFFGSDVRRVVVGNGAFPTDAAARFYRADPAVLSETFWDAVAVPAAQTAERTEKLRRLMAGNHVVRIAAPGGTELELRVSRPPVANNGVLTDEMLLAKGAKQSFLPAGEVVAVPVEFFASGRLTADAVECSGVLVRGLKLAFKDGKASLDGGGEGYEAFKKAFELAGGDKAVIAAFGIGTNPASRPTGFFRSSEMAGVVTLAIGYNRQWGGMNASPFRAVFRLPDATVRVDEAVLVDKGALRLK